MFLNFSFTNNRQLYREHIGHLESGIAHLVRTVRERMTIGRKGILREATIAKIANMGQEYPELV